MKENNENKELNRQEALDILRSGGPIYRTVDTTVDLLKTIDPGCKLTSRMIRMMMKNGELKTKRIGKKHLINVKNVIECLELNTNDRETEICRTAGPDDDEKERKMGEFF